MATLNIKNFPDELHDELKNRAERDRRSVAREVIFLLETALEKPERCSILDLAGLGAEYWKNLEPSDLVAEERSSWDS